jgi:hypothetical protein
MFERLKSAVTNDLPHWFGQTPTGKKILSEKEAVEAASAAELQARRRDLCDELEKAIHSEELDPQLKALKSELSECAKKVRNPKTGVVNDEAVARVRELQAQVKKLGIRHRSNVNRLRAEIEAIPLPEGVAAAIENAIDDLESRWQVCANIRTRREKRHFDSTAKRHPQNFHIILEVESFEPAIRKTSDLIPKLRSSILDLRYTNITALEASDRIRDILSELPELRPTRLRRDPKTGGLVPAGLLGSLLG